MCGGHVGGAVLPKGQLCRHIVRAGILASIGTLRRTFLGWEEKEKQRCAYGVAFG